MKNNRSFIPKAMAILLLAMAMFTPNDLKAQLGTITFDNPPPPADASKEEKLRYLRSKMVENIEPADYVALVYVPPISANDAAAYDCFYGKDAKTIYTAVKVQLQHDYKGGFVTKNKEAIVVVKGGIIGDDDQLHPSGDRHRPFVRLKTGGTYLLTAYSPPEEFQNRHRDKDFPVYFIEYEQIRVADFQNSSLHYMGFSTEDEFDSFVYKTLKKARKKRKKKDVGFGESSTRVLGTRHSTGILLAQLLKTFYICR